jgi:phosphoglycerate dehydrogenase-like enzyme
MNIYIDTPFREAHKQYLRRAIQHDELVFKDELATPREQLAALLSADILLGNPKPVEWLQQADNLKWVQLYSTGFEYYSHINIPAVITNMQDYYSQPCAETVVAGILALYRGMDTCTRLKEQQKWVGYTLRKEFQLLSGKKIILLGWGNIGKRTAAILKGFNCEINIYSRSSSDAHMHTAEELKKQLPNADIVIGCLPGTDQTRGMFTTEMIQLMKPGAVFCNVGRGNLLQDEQALIAALHQNKLGGAVLDVTAEEPIPAQHPLWECPNTILSQHSGGGSSTEYEGIAELFIQNLEAFKRGEPLKNQIQFEKGY